MRERVFVLVVVLACGEPATRATAPAPPPRLATSASAAAPVPTATPPRALPAYDARSPIKVDILEATAGWSESDAPRHLRLTQGGACQERIVLNRSGRRRLRVAGHTLGANDALVAQGPGELDIVDVDNHFSMAALHAFAFTVTIPCAAAPRTLVTRAAPHRQADGPSDAQRTTVVFADANLTVTVTNGGSALSGAPEPDKWQTLVSYGDGALDVGGTHYRVCDSFDGPCQPLEAQGPSRLPMIAVPPGETFSFVGDSPIEILRVYARATP